MARLRWAEIRATGYGVLPAGAVESVVRATGARLPDWLGRTFEAAGEGRDAECATPQGKLRAFRGAEREAKRKLAAVLDDLRLPDGSRLGELARREDAVALELESLLADVEIQNARLDGDTAFAMVRVPAMRVWDVVNAVNAPGASVDLVYTPELSATSTGDSVVTLALLDGSSTTLRYVYAPEPTAALTALAALSALAALARSARR